MTISLFSSILSSKTNFEPSTNKLSSIAEKGSFIVVFPATISKDPFPSLTDCTSPISTLTPLVKSTSFTTILLTPSLLTIGLLDLLSSTAFVCSKSQSIIP
ncbi:hypothetical protein D3C81_1983570 [compost metagenome]